MSNTNKLSQWYKDLSSGSRTAIVGGVGLAAVLAVGTYFDNSTNGPQAVKAATQKDSFTVLNPGSSTATEGVAASLEAAKKQISDQNQKIALLQAQATQAATQNQGADGHWSELSNLVAQVQSLQERLNTMGDKGQGVPAASKEKTILDKLLPSVADFSKGLTAPPGSTPSQAVPASGIGGGDNAQASPPAPSAANTIQVVGEVKKTLSKLASKKVEPTPFIPAGSNFEAVLMNGMDASTSIGANRNPTPALLRIKTDAILPNLASYNVRECFVMVGGFGNMSTERVEMRTESLSCVAENGEVYEGKIEGYLVGEDGKAGARGRIVSKQGAILAKSFMAGFVGGIGGAFAPQPVPALNIAGGATTAYQYPGSQQVVGNGISTGLNKSSQALSAFYIKLAEQMFPIVELDAGRKMTIILIKGVELKMERRG
jgi:conjugal transfer pilus assembly protein TraB